MEINNIISKIFDWNDKRNMWKMKGNHFRRLSFTLEEEVEVLLDSEAFRKRRMDKRVARALSMKILDIIAGIKDELMKKDWYAKKFIRKEPVKILEEGDFERYINDEDEDSVGCSSANETASELYECLDPVSKKDAYINIKSSLDRGWDKIIYEMGQMMIEVNQQLDLNKYNMPPDARKNMIGELMMQSFENIMKNNDKKGLEKDGLNQIKKNEKNKGFECLSSWEIWDIVSRNRYTSKWDQHQE